MQTCAVLTTEAKGAMQELHQRMPVTIAPRDYQVWLDCSSEQTATADQLLLDTTPDYQYYAVNSTVGNSRNEGPDLIKPM